MRFGHDVAHPGAEPRLRDAEGHRPIAEAVGNAGRLVARRPQVEHHAIADRPRPRARQAGPRRQVSRSRSMPMSRESRWRRYGGIRSSGPQQPPQAGHDDDLVRRPGRGTGVNDAASRPRWSGPVYTSRAGRAGSSRSLCCARPRPAIAGPTCSRRTRRARRSSRAAPRARGRASRGGPGRTGCRGPRAHRRRTEGASTPRAAGRSARRAPGRDGNCGLLPRDAAIIVRPTRPSRSGCPVGCEASRLTGRSVGAGSLAACGAQAGAARERREAHRWMRRARRDYAVAHVHFSISRSFRGYTVPVGAGFEHATLHMAFTCWIDLRRTPNRTSVNRRRRDRRMVSVDRAPSRAVQPGNRRPPDHRPAARRRQSAHPSNAAVAYPPRRPQHDHGPRMSCLSRTACTSSRCSRSATAPRNGYRMVGIPDGLGMIRQGANLVLYAKLPRDRRQRLAQLHADGIVRRHGQRQGHSSRAGSYRPARPSEFEGGLGLHQPRRPVSGRLSTRRTSSRPGRASPTTRPGPDLRPVLLRHPVRPRPDSTTRPARPATRASSTSGTRRTRTTAMSFGGDQGRRRDGAAAPRPVRLGEHEARRQPVRHDARHGRRGRSDRRQPDVGLRRHQAAAAARRSPRPASPTATTTSSPRTTRAVTTDAAVAHRRTARASAPASTSWTTTGTPPVRSRTRTARPTA